MENGGNTGLLGLSSICWQCPVVRICSLQQPWGDVLEMSRTQIFRIVTVARVLQITALYARDRVRDRLQKNMPSCAIKETLRGPVIVAGRT